MNYSFHIPIDVRSTVGTSDGPKRRVKGYASIPNKVDTYKYELGMDGRVVNGWHSLFTKNAVESMRKQMASRPVFFDVEHELASHVNIRSILDQTDTLASVKDKIMSYVKLPEVPMMKIASFDVDDTGLLIEGEFNPYYPDMGAEYRAHYDVVWNSAKDGFFNGFSINFLPTKFEDQIINGKWVSVIDDVDLYGVSLTSKAALPENSVVEVAVRSVVELKRSGEMQVRTMTENTIDVLGEMKQMKAELEAMKLAKIESDRQAELAKMKAEQVAEMDRLKAELASKQVELEKAKTTTVLPERRAIVSGHSEELTASNSLDAFRENLQNLSLGQLIQLQAEYDLTKMYPVETREFLGKSTGDLLVSRG